jgi:dTDP-4-amino-4,6-dideoxygalactose transaminase
MLDVSDVLAPVPFYDLAPANALLRKRFLDEVGALLDSGAFTNGPQVAAFEEAWAEACGVRHAVGVASGLDALRIALLALGVEPGDEVIVPAATFVATFEAVTQVGAVPVPVDVTERDDGLDVAAAAAAVGRRTRALLPVHLYGQMADMRGLRGLAVANDLLLVEDACQAHGARRAGLRAGAAGDAAAFSFYPGKNLGAFGDAGAIVTDDVLAADLARALREHGQLAKYTHLRPGYTARLDTIQAIALLLKLELLPVWNRQRADSADLYDALLGGVGDLRLPPRAPGSEPAWHLYVIRTPRRDALAAALADRGVATGLHYPEPPHLSQAYASLGYPEGSFPVAERLSREGLSLPLFPGMSEAQQEAVGDAIRSFYDGR